jgi:hypothetical protein
VDDPLQELALIREFWERYHHRLQRVVIQPLMEYPFQEQNRGQKQLYGDERFIHYDWNYYAGDYLVFYPRAVPASVLQEELRRTFQHVHGVPGCCRRNWDYRGSQALVRYTHRTKDRNLGRYVEFLRQKEKGLYDRQGCLIAERLLDDEKPRELGIPGMRMPQVTLGGEPEREWAGARAGTRAAEAMRRAAAMLMA